MGDQDRPPPAYAESKFHQGYASLLADKQCYDQQVTHGRTVSDAIDICEGRTPGGGGTASTRRDTGRARTAQPTLTEVGASASSSSG